MYEILSKIYVRLRFYIIHFFLLYIKKDIHTINVAKWHKDSANSDIRFDVPLLKNSVVIDLGGYIGNWSGEIDKRYSPTIFIYEPVQEYFELIKNRFRERPNIFVMNYGLSNIDEDTEIALKADGSSTYSHGKTTNMITLKNIIAEFSSIDLQTIDLIKINVEGAEYDLLESMIEHSIFTKINYLQIQFHRFIPDAITRRELIRKKLYETHELIFDYPFVWEGWKRKLN